LQVKQIQILIADSHALIRSGARSFLTNIPEVDFVIEATDGSEALRLVEHHQPDVVLLDPAILDPDGLKVTARITKEFPTTRFIIFSFDASGEYARQALSAGALGFLLKSSSRAEFETAVNSVARGRTYVSRAVEYRRRDRRETSLPALTSRQRETLQLIAEGQSTKEIALSLNISAKTVETHRAQLMDRLDIHNVVGLVRYAINNGLIQLD
jgi:DNA-binding NarL/FixJ family response regulator